MSVGVRYHKAEVVYQDKTILTSKRCHSWRPEAILRSNRDGSVLATAYFGMGTRQSTGLEYNFVAFTSKLSVLVAIMKVIEDKIERHLGGYKPHYTINE